ncbi:uncharacterized protein B0P05DRAFT_558220 [Gilbertella persicaria]|uniref:uncharacterized protein n=1 Tax=Gilbertella persicaria TaxID=101096 RepID=UPI00221F868B|nr:uncharacterized protein B0P05DRAFT_558220 [Gilbertella persicaria]KAI8059961.1 hypothetical protein B0P05DRAFT_558220 [Gilbertella persicaria]
MSHTPPSHKTHARQISLPTVYEDNDPYRIVKKSPRIANSDHSSDFDAVHSRTASDSSTSRLYPLAPDYEDPYAKAHKKYRHISDRANSYLPYSHHLRDPNQKTEPIHLQEEDYIAPPLSLGVGSMLQDNITDQINMNRRPSQAPHAPYTDKILPVDIKRRKKKRCCGMRYRTVAFLSLLAVAVIVVVWFFVWPRVPSLSVEDVDNVGTLQVVTNTTKMSLSTQWQLNITADNSDNWVPTRISSIDVTIVDDSTQLAFGAGSTGSLVLSPRKKSAIAIPMDIHYETTLTNDTTFQDLYNACGVQVTSSMPFENQQDVLNVTLHVTFHIAGIVWSPMRDIPIHGLICPTN